jgi:hypothetical protein
MLGLRRQKNSKIQGNIGLATAILWFEQNDYRTYVPLTDSQEDDLVVKINGKLYSVQIKTTYCEYAPGRYMLNLRVMGGNRSGTGKVKHFDPNEVDFVFALTDNGEKYLIPSSAISCRHSLKLGGPKYAQYRVE